MDPLSFLNIIKTIVVLVIVTLLANISLKFINKNMFKRDKLIKIVEKVSLSSSSSIGIVLICNQYYLMSFNGSDNKILKELDKEELDYILENMEEEKEFSFDKGSISEIFKMREKN